MTTRWVFTDPVAADSWVFPRNPSRMDSPTRPRVTLTVGSPMGVVRAVRSGTPAQAWTFKGVVVDEAMYAALTDWSRRPNQVFLTDHRSRVLTVIPVRFEPIPRRSRRTVWVHDYTFHCLLLGSTT